MTDEELEIICHLGRCTFLPGSADKRFVKNMVFAAEHDPDRELTERQTQYLIGLRHKYRRQIPASAPQIVLAAIEAKRHNDSRKQTKTPPKPPQARQRDLFTTTRPQKPR